MKQQIKVMILIIQKKLTVEKENIEVEQNEIKGLDYLFHCGEIN